MSKYESIEILPLNMVDFFENNYPGCWNMIGFNLADIKSNSVNYNTKIVKNRQLPFENQKKGK